jgi:CRISPR-associated protein (Cas_Cas5)
MLWSARHSSHHSLKCKTNEAAHWYLNEARFIATFEGDSETITSAAEHLENPLWGVWFGRKTCLPAMPLSPVTAEDSPSAARILLDRVRHWQEQTSRQGSLDSDLFGIRPSGSGRFLNQMDRQRRIDHPPARCHGLRTDPWAGDFHHTCSSQSSRFCP